MRALALTLGLFAALASAPASAYIGPGAGAGVIAVVLGVIAAFFFALVGIVWYPVKRLFTRRRKPAEEKDEEEGQDPAGP